MAETSITIIVALGVLSMNMFLILLYIDYLIHKRKG